MPTEQRVARAEAPETAPDPTAAAQAATLEVPPELVAQSLGEWFRAWLTRIRSGDSGVLPVLLALLIITLGGLLTWQGAMLIILGLALSGYPSLAGLDANRQVLYNLMNGTIDPVVSWVAMAVVVIGIAALLWFGDSRRRRSGLVAPPVSLTLIKIVLIAIVGISVVAICNINRAANGTLAGVPWVIPIVLAVFGAWMVLLQRTKFGRYVYAIGGNPEAARRAGINLAAVRTLCFIICSFTAGIGLLLYASYLGGMSGNINGGQLVLYAIASVVLAGTSLFGGRGKVIHGILGGLVICGIYNGMGLLGLDVRWQFIVTGLVLLVAITIDSLSRRSATSGSAARV